MAQTLASNGSPSDRRTQDTGHGMYTQRAPAFVPSARDLQVVDSTLSVVGGDVHNHYYHAERQGDIWAILRLIPNFRNIYQDMLSKVTPGTGMWLIKGDKFRLWLEPNGDIKIFWGSGIPGAGKTLLASIVIERLEALRRESDAAICVCYVYFRYSDRSEVTVRNVLEIIVKQTLERHSDCRALIERTYAQHLRENSVPSEVQLLGLIQELNNGMACTFYVLDALDEAPTRVQLTIVRTLASLDVKLFITSRPLKAVDANFPEAYSFPIIAQDGDIDLHITKGLAESADLQNLIRQVGPSLREEIVSTIKQNCGGMFLHASLQLDALAECVSAHAVRRALKAFPSRIEGVYLQTWNRILKQDADNVSLAKAVLVWVLNASRSMTLEELERAVATCPGTHKFEPDRRVPGTTLMSLCRGLVVVEEESRLVRLVHYTAKDTLEGLLRPAFPHPHSLLAAVCVAHLVECGFQNTTISTEEDFRMALKADPLLAYASETWAFHARESLVVDDSHRRTAHFVAGSNALPALTSLDRSAFFDILAPLHILALYHLPLVLIKDITSGDPNVTTRIRQQSPLMLACRIGNKGLVENLVTLSDIQVNLVTNQGRSALMMAARYGHEGCVKLLLARPDIQVNLVDTNGGSALMTAARYAHEGCVELLLARPDIQVNLAETGGWPALMTAASYGHEGSVKLLLARPDIQVNLVDTGGWTALMQAARYGHQGSVKLLLEHPDIQGNLVQTDGWSALMMAARYDHEGSVKLLLEHPDIQVNLVDTYGWSALMMAARYGHEGCANLLLARPDIQVNPFTNHGRSALMMAARYGHEGCVKHFLKHPDIQVNLVNTHGRSALILAVENHHEAVARMLLDMPDVDTTIRSAAGGHTTLSVAQAKGHSSILELLRDFESRTVGPPMVDQTPLRDGSYDDGSDTDRSEDYYNAYEGLTDVVGSSSPYDG